MVAAVKEESPSTETWVGLLPHSGEPKQIKGFVGIKDLDGIGLDIYGGLPEREELIRQAFAYVRSHGKKAGVCECWWEDMFVRRQFESPANEQKEADWLSASTNSPWKRGRLAVSCHSSATGLSRLSRCLRRD